MIYDVSIFHQQIPFGHEVQIASRHSHRFGRSLAFGGLAKGQQDCRDCRVSLGKCFLIHHLRPIATGILRLFHMMSYQLCPNLMKHLRIYIIYIDHYRSLYISRSTFRESIVLHVWSAFGSPLQGADGASGEQAEQRPIRENGCCRV